MNNSIYPIIEEIRQKNYNISNGFHHVASLFKKGGSIVFGENKMKNFCNKNKCRSCYLHAEMDVLDKMSQIKHIKKNGGKYNLLVVRLKSNGDFGMSRPCYLCVNKIIKSHIKINKIYYSDENGEIISEKKQDLLDIEKIYFTNGYRSHLIKYLENNYGDIIEISDYIEKRRKRKKNINVKL